MSSKGKSNMVGNREIAQEVAEGITYAANDLNQYTRISTNGENFTPEYDEDGNQTRVRTSTGIWKVQYNAQNRAIRYGSEADSTHIITCVYDSQGRRVEKKEEKEGAAISHVRYVYRGYLQVAAYDLLAEGLPSLWQIIWDPTQEIATRPLAIRANGAYSTYGWDLTKNICETYAGATGFLVHRYAYSPYGLVSIEGDTSYQPIQWSSEVYDAELGLVYYNYRYYNPLDGRWTRRDPAEPVLLEAAYVYMKNSSLVDSDYLGEKSSKDTSVEECNQMAENYLAEVLRKYKAFQECNVTIECRCDNSSFAETSGTNIVMKLPKSMKDGSGGFINTINHELVHVYDNCKRGGMYDCKSMIFSEVRASYYGQCVGRGKGNPRKECVRKAVMRSMRQNMEGLRKAGADMSKWNCLETLEKDFEEAYEEMKRNPHNPFT